MKRVHKNEVYALMATEQFGTIKGEYGNFVFMPRWAYTLLVVFLFGAGMLVGWAYL